MSERSEGVARLACFELWGGNSIAAHAIELPGLQGWVWSTPSGHALSGGDVHYISVCSKGRVSRIALADVAGHGEQASALAERLRRVLQHHTDNWDQSALMRELNEEFERHAHGVRFATAVVLGFYVGSGELLFTNAGHLPLLWYHSQTGAWDWLEAGTPYARKLADLPLGLIRGTDYEQTAVELGRGDLLVLYTDGVTESRAENGRMLGPEGLLALVREIDSTALAETSAFGHALAAKIQSYRGRAPQSDDQTVLILQRVARDV